MGFSSFHVTISFDHTHDMISNRKSKKCKKNVRLSAPNTVFSDKNFEISDNWAFDRKGRKMLIQPDNWYLCIQIYSFDFDSLIWCGKKSGVLTT